MNRYRLNQILEVLLFPVIDPRLGKEDVLLSFYQAYQRIEVLDKSPLSGSAQRDKALREYKKCQTKLIDYLSQRCQGKMKSEDDILLLCKLYHPMEGIQQEMTLIKRGRLAKNYVDIQTESICLYYLKKLSSVAEALITYRDGIAAIRQWNGQDGSAQNNIFRSESVYNKVEIWNLLCRMTVPDLYIVMAAVDKGFGLEALYEQKSYIALADKLLNKVLQKGIAENHMHFNVGMDYEAVWLYYTDLQFLENQNGRKRKRDDYVRLEVSVFRALAARYIENGQYEEGFDDWLHWDRVKYMKDLVYAMVHDSAVQEISSELYSHIMLFYQELSVREAVREGDYLLAGIYDKYLEYKVSSEFIFLYQSYRYIVTHETDTFFARAFLQYIRFKNAFFYDRQERNVWQGLGYFRRRYHDMKTAAVEVMRKPDVMLESFRFQAKIGCLKKLEIRIAPEVQESDVCGLDFRKAQQIIKSKLYDQIYEILSAYRKYLLECLIGVRKTWRLLKQEERQGTVTKEITDIIHGYGSREGFLIPQLGVIFHFIKTEQTADTLDAYCWRDVQGIGNLPSRMNRRYFAADIAQAVEEIRSTISELDEYLVGIDAASEENVMEPWMFSQAYQLMRSHLSTKPVLKSSDGREEFHRIQNIGFTYHVGEDFRHLVSGLRHTDEVLEKFGYRAGDRLGHALVLGVDAAQWVSENEVVPISVLEHLENLLWMWGVNTCDEYYLPVRLEILEDKILNIAERIYPNAQTITIKMLYQAYQRKFDSDHALVARKMNGGEQAAEEELGRVRNCVECERKFCSAWDSDKLLMTNYCPGYIQKYERIELVPVGKDEIEVYQKLQEYLIRKVEQKGIYLEMNPTSNLTIGDFSQIKNHPVFKLSDLRGEERNHVLLTVNSDDPAVFNTNVENELAYIYYAAEESGSSKSEILEWIDRIRQQGMDASFIKREKRPDEILLEVQEIMDRINKVNR